MSRARPGRDAAAVQDTGDTRETDLQHAAGRTARVLFVCVPQTGHVTPLLPLAEALAGAGADVVVASGPDVREAVAGRGLPFRPVGPEFGAWYARLAERTCGRPGDGLPPDRVEPYFIPRLFAEVGLSLMLDGLDEAVGAVGPDLLIFEPHALAAPLVAARHGVRAVPHTIGLPWEPLVVDLVADAVTPAWRAAGLPAPVRAGCSDDLAIDICPPTLSGRDLGGPQRVLTLRPTPPPEPERPLPVEIAAPDRPLVYVTLGTFANSDRALFRSILRALADLPVSVLVTAGTDAAAAELGRAPANAAIAGFVPQAAILPHCAAVVHHAGAGTTFGLLAHGLPSLALPQSADNFRIAHRLGAAGAARVLPPEQLDEAAIREAVRAVLAQPTYRDNATRIASEIAAMPAATEIVPALLTAARATRPDRRQTG